MYETLSCFIEKSVLYYNLSFKPKFDTFFVFTKNKWRYLQIKL